MGGLELAAGLVALLVYLWWWPVMRWEKAPNSPSSSALGMSQSEVMSELLVQCSLSPSVTAAIEDSLELFALLAPQRAALIAHAAELERHFGIATRDLLHWIHARVLADVAEQQRWEESTAAARTTSLVLLAMPVVFLGVASSLGIPAHEWLFTTPGGWVCLVVGVGLTVAARRLMSRLQPTFQVAQTKRIFDPTKAAVLAGIAVVLFRSDFLGIVTATMTAITVHHWWRSYLLSQRTLSLFQEQEIFHVVVATHLADSGFSWVEGIEAAIENDSGELEAVLQRLRWGVDPEIALSSSAGVWHEVSKIFGASARHGIAVVDLLRVQTNNWIAALESHRMTVIEKRAAVAVVPVSLLQLPAFIIVGVVPVVVTQISSIADVFFSTT